MPELKISYEVLEHKSDTGFLVKAPSLERLYINAALSLTDMMVKLDLIKEKDRHSLSISADDKESLMVRWLNEILFLFESQKFIAHRILFTQFDGKKITATLWGETYQPLKHGGVSEIKSATFHQLEVGESASEPSFFAKVFLDL